MNGSIATLAYKHALLARLEQLSRNDFDEFDKMRQKYATSSAEEILDYCHRQLQLIDDVEYRNIQNGWMPYLRYIIRRFGEALALVGRHGPELDCTFLQTEGAGPPRVFIEHDQYRVDVIVMVHRESTRGKGITSSEAECLRQIRSTVDGVLAEMEQSVPGPPSGF